MATNNNLRPAVSDAQRRRALAFLAIAVGAVGFTMAIQMGLNTNFLVQEIHIRPEQVGILEAFRESCGIVAFGVLALLAGLAEPMVGAAMLVLLGTGLAAYAYVHSFTWIVVMSLVWSQGLHVWMPLPNSMTLAVAEPGRAGRRLGQIAAAGAIGTGLGLVAALTLTHFKIVSMRPIYIIAGTAAVIAAAACLAIPRNIKTPGPRLVVRRRYGLYYFLCFLEGWRKQIFLSFAPFLLVNNHGTSLEVILLLWIAIQAIGYVASPMVGRLIDRVGERRILIFYYACLSCFFVGYAVAPVVGILYVLFVVDSAFFVFAMALTTYVNRIAPTAEHTPTLSMGVAMNHVAAVVMPLAGGFLWAAVGYSATFLMGAAAAALSIFVVLRLPRHVAPQSVL